MTDILSGGGGVRAKHTTALSKKDFDWWGGGSEPNIQQLSKKDRKHTTAV